MGAGWALASCGYHVGGKADLVPEAVQTISIPAFTTLSTQYRLVDVLPQQIAREFTARTRFRIVANPNDADAVLNGTINSVQTYPAIFDPTSGKATTLSVIVVLTLNLVQRSTGKVLYSRANASFRQDYDVSIYPHSYFDESGPALDRLSRDVARNVVSAIVENF